MPSSLSTHDFRFPSFVARIGQRLPQFVSQTPLMLVLDCARRLQWLSAPESLYGKSFKLSIEDLGLNFYFKCEQGKFVRCGAQQVDLSLSACAIDFAKLASGAEDADTLFFRRRLRIEGDTELGVAVKYWIDASERPEWLTRLGTAFASNSA